jgi:D-alanine-D-alanine ligase
MEIAFTYDLKDDYLTKGYNEVDIAEFDSQATIDAISSAIEKIGHTVNKVGNVFSLTERLSSGKRFPFVFNICEGLYGLSRESLVPALLDSYRIPYAFSEPLAHAITLNKAYTKRLLKFFGLPTADFCVLDNPKSNLTINAKYPLFVKAVGEGTAKGITPKSIVNNETELRKRVCELFEEFHEPILVEPFLPGREVTVGVLGTADSSFCLGVMNVDFTDKADSPIHSYYNKAFCEQTALYTLAEDSFSYEASRIALAAHKFFELRDASRIDIRADSDGTPMIMEINSLPGLSPKRSDLILLSEMVGYTYQDTISMILSSALSRVYEDSGLL